MFSFELGPGQSLDVHPGQVGMFQDGVQFGIRMVPAIKNLIFGGDGLFLDTLTGPGTVWLQSLQLPNVAASIWPYPQPAQTMIHEGTPVQGAPGAGSGGGLRGRAGLGGGAAGPAGELGA